MEKWKKHKRRPSKLPNSAVIFAKRSLSLSKIYSGMGIFFASVGIFISGILAVFGKDVAEITFLLPVPFMVFGMFMFATPIILLYVYDKNNGVLEYLLSLGWNQSDIFKRYLKASLFLALTFFIAEFAANVIVSVIAGTQAVILLDLVVLALTAAFGFSVVSLVTVAMIAFSSLQKQRVGGNSPLAFAIGALLIIPTFYIPFLLPFSIGILVDPFIAGFAGALSIVLLILSSRLIRREKMLP
jgi:hypothetical protein